MEVAEFPDISPQLGRSLAAQGPKSWPMTLWALRCAEMRWATGPSSRVILRIFGRFGSKGMKGFLAALDVPPSSPYNINKQPFPCYRWFGKQLGLLVLLSALPQWWQDWQDVPSFLHQRSVSYCAQKKAASGAFSIELNVTSNAESIFAKNVTDMRQIWPLSFACCIENLTVT